MDVLGKHRCKKSRDPAIAVSQRAEARASNSCWQLHPHFMQFPAIFFSSFLGKINPSPFEKHEGCQATGASEREREREREERRDTSEQKWGISSCCPSGPCTDARLRRTHTHYNFTHTQCSLCGAHSDWELVEGHNKKRTAFTAECGSQRKSGRAVTRPLASDEIGLSKLRFPARPHSGQRWSWAKSCKDLHPVTMALSHPHPSVSFQ